MLLTPVLTIFTDFLSAVVTPVLTIFTDFLSAVVTSEIAQILSLYGGGFFAL